jgi:hypothetical protein
MLDPNDRPELFIREGGPILSVNGRRFTAGERASTVQRRSWVRTPNEKFIDEALEFVRESREWLDIRRRESRTAAAAAREPW